MKKTFSLLAGSCLLAMTILPVSSCRKLDLLQSDPRNGKTDFKQCTITEITNGIADGPDAAHRIMTYNNKRDPIVAEPASVGTGSPRWLFYYDKKGRLVTYAGVYNGGGFEFWHNYHYDNMDRIVSDSNYAFGAVGNLPGAFGWRHSQVTYDHLNRVVKEDVTASPSEQVSPFTITYLYDATGNLDGSSFAYDNKVNPYRTNKVWQFVFKDYSRNNRVLTGLFAPVPTYNDFGLPVSLPNLRLPNFILFFLSSTGPAMDITYACSPPKGPINY